MTHKWATQGENKQIELCVWTLINNYALRLERGVCVRLYALCAVVECDPYSLGRLIQKYI